MIMNSSPSQISKKALNSIGLYNDKLQELSVPIKIKIS